LPSQRVRELDRRRFTDGHCNARLATAASPPEQERQAHMELVVLAAGDSHLTFVADGKQLDDEP
jgi:hypothetical protein